MTLQEKLKSFDGSLALENARTLSSEWYLDSEIHELEKLRVFNDTWQLVARLDQLTEAGAYVTAKVGSHPVVVVRDRLGEIRAFSNVCRHKAAKVMTETCGKAPALQCRYHGWTYDLQGKLKATPEFEDVCGFEKEENALPRLAVSSLGPFVFVRLNPTGPTLESQYSEFSQRIATLGLERLNFVERREYLLKCNWKVFVDNYLDGGYHVNTLHPSLAGVIQYDQYTTEIYGCSSLQSSPLGTTKREGTEEIASVRKGLAQYWWLMPNLMINIYDGVMDTNLVIPVDATSCRVIFDFYFTETEGVEAMAWNQKSIAVAHQVQLEDEAVSESVQEGLQSGAYKTGRFSVRREKAVYHFHRLLAQSLTQGLIRVT